MRSLYYGIFKGDPADNWDPVRPSKGPIVTVPRYKNVVRNHIQAARRRLDWALKMNPAYDFHGAVTPREYQTRLAYEVKHNDDLDGVPVVEPVNRPMPRPQPEPEDDPWDDSDLLDDIEFEDDLMDDVDAVLDAE